MTTNAEVNILCKLPEMRNYRYIADFRYFNVVFMITICELQTKLHNLCTARRDGTKSIPDTLRGIGHCVRWK